MIETSRDRYAVSAGDLIFIHQNEWARHSHPDETGQETYWVGFTGPYVEDYVCMKLFGEQTSFVRHVGYSTELIDLYEQVLSCASEGSQRMRILSLSYLMQIVAFAAGVSNDLEVPASSGIAHMATTYIRRNMFTEIDLEALAQSYGLSYGRFRALFKSKLGTSPYQFLLTERLACAQRLLADPTLSIKNAAFKSGFNSQANFTKIFKRKMGVSPMEMRDKQK